MQPLTISFIVAAGENNVIGRDNQLPWHLPTDMKYFKNTTWGLPVIMGRKSFEALGKPLPGRRNVVVTRNLQWTAPGVETATGIREAIEMARSSDTKEIFITGGGEIFKQAMPLATRIYLTRVHGTFEGDAFFPELDHGDWEMVRSVETGPDEKNAFALSFQVWERRKN